MPQSDLNGGNQDVNVPAILLGLGALGWLTVGTPLVHLTERNARGAVTSLALRVVLPLGAGLVGAAIDGPGSVEDPHATLGLIGGSLAASTIDALVVANVERPGRVIFPTIAARGGGVQLGFAGAF
jgi:hypothetical protein